MQTLRLQFSKTGDAKFLSHLDLNRVFSRAVKRSGADVWYTEGFHSHLYLLFALPLALGIESICETVDLKFAELPGNPDIADGINRFLPEGLHVFNTLLPKHSSGDIAFARYYIELADSAERVAALGEAVEKIMALPEILVEKKGKKGIHLVNIKEQIHECAAVVQPESIYLNVLLDAGNEKTLNPVVLTDQILRLAAPPLRWNIRRIQVLTKEGENFE